ncbi:MAG: hypothetical protein J6W79_01895 [Alphaproteobacteria bacterium]|nr:hypothetical protein [Alphaproteobacteria bacterium]
MATFREFIDNIFNNPPVSVEAPRPQTKHYSDAGTRLEAYIVKVTHKNGRVSRLSFAVDHDHFCLTSKSHALKRATRCYNRKCAKIKRLNENTK